MLPLVFLAFPINGLLPKLVGIKKPIVNENVVALVIFIVTFIKYSAFIAGVVN